MKVLIAEDDAVSRLRLQRAVEKLGHEVFVAENGARAWELFCDADIDTVISDWQMPGMNGPEFCRRVREHERLSRYTYFIFLSALVDRSHLIEGMAEGADDYLSKPLDTFDLAIRLNVAERVTSLYRTVAQHRAETEKLNEELFIQSRRDSLTELGNRRRMQEDLETLQGRVERYGHTYSVVLFDVDHFKKYNDRYGHQAGDEVLRVIARLTTAQCRQGDSAYRYGGEEFLLILPEQTLESAAKAAEKLRQTIASAAIPHEASQPYGVVTISAGVAALTAGAQDGVATLLRGADTALYTAKTMGRNRVKTFAPSLGSHIEV